MKKHENSAPPDRAAQTKKNADAEARAPESSSSTGYYPFASDYPGEQRAEGVLYRADAPKKFTRRQKLLIAAAAALVFCAAFTVCRIMMHISEKQPGSVGDAPVWETESTVPVPEIVTAPPGDG
ncbi:MAG: hypothetical protein IJL26_12940 [Clostridia bacterium]|nr:hypothetical protein [Clostridia bacterium]